MMFLKELKKKCPCPVHEKFDKSGSLGFRGEYYHMRLGRPEGAIILQKNRPGTEKEATFVHELGHVRCDKRRCSCIPRDGVQRELHAELYALHFLLRHKRKRALRFRINTFHQYGCCTKFPHSSAFKIVRTRRIYKRCLRYLKQPTSSLREALIGLFD